MKIRPDHYATIAAALDAIRPLWEAAKPDYQAAGHSDKRFHWDAFRAAKVGGVRTDQWLCNTLYPYMNDSHIDTALRRYFQETSTSS